METPKNDYKKMEKNIFNKSFFIDLWKDNQFGSCIVGRKDEL